MLLLHVTLKWRLDTLPKIRLPIQLAKLAIVKKLGEEVRVPALRDLMV